MIIRQELLGVSMCPMLAWEREDQGLEQQAGKACSARSLGSCLDQQTVHVPQDPDQGCDPVGKEKQGGGAG